MYQTIQDGVLDVLPTEAATNASILKLYYLLHMLILISLSCNRADVDANLITQRLYGAPSLDVLSNRSNREIALQLICSSFLGTQFLYFNRIRFSMALFY